MENLLQNIASGLWIVLGAYCFFWLRKWNKRFSELYDCSICDDRILDNGHSWNYCPNCGAKMDGGYNDAAD